MNSAIKPYASAGILAPIPPMPGYYASEGERGAWVRRIFDDTAPDYDRVERVLSLGSGKWYRRQALRRAGLSPGMSVADVATGTGLVAREAKALVGPTGRVVGIDPSEGMLKAGHVSRARLGIEGKLGWAESLPLGDAEFDLITMGYALRHVADLRAVFAEFARVLKPGGRICLLEITKPAGRLGSLLMHGYIGAMSGVVCRGIGASARCRELWRYYWETIDLCIRPAEVIAALTGAGFERASRRVALGMFSEYTGTRAE